MIHNRRRRRRRRVERFRDATTTNSCCLLPAGRVDRPRSDGAACSKSSVFQLADLTTLRAYLRETHWSLSRVVRSAAADVAGRRRLRSASRGRVKLWSTCVLFCRSFSCDLLITHKHVGWLGSRVVSVLVSGAEGTGFRSQPRRCRVTILGKLFKPIVPLFTKQRNW